MRKHWWTLALKYKMVKKTGCDKMKLRQITTQFIRQAKSGQKWRYFLNQHNFTIRAGGAEAKIYNLGLFSTSHNALHQPYCTIQDTKPNSRWILPIGFVHLLSLMLSSGRPASREWLEIMAEEVAWLPPQYSPPWPQVAPWTLGSLDNRIIHLCTILLYISV